MLRHIRLNNGSLIVLFLSFILATIPFSRLLPSIGIICLTALWISTANFSKKWDLLKKNIPALLMIGFFILSVISLSYTSDLQEGWAKVETRLPLLIFPLVIGSISLIQNQKDIVLKIFLAAAIASCLWGSLLVALHFQAKVEAGISLNFDYYQWQFPQLISFHAPRYALYLGCAAFVAFDFWERKKNWVFLGIFFLLNIFLLIISSRTALIAQWLLLFLYFGYKAYKTRNYFQILIPSLVLTVMAVVLWFGSPYLVSKLQNASGTSERIGWWQAGIEVWCDSPIWGVGIGDASAEVGKKYAELINKDYSETYLDLHNQYINILSQLGTIGLACLLLSFITSLYWAVKSKNRINVFFTLFFLLTFVTETLLASQQSIATITLLYCLTIILPKNNASTN